MVLSPARLRCSPASAIDLSSHEEEESLEGSLTCVCLPLLLKCPLQKPASHALRICFLIIRSPEISTHHQPERKLQPGGSTRLDVCCCTMLYSYLYHLGFLVFREASVASTDLQQENPNVPMGIGEGKVAEGRL